MHNPHADLFLTPTGMLQVSFSLAHLMHTDVLIQLLLAWTSESAHCHFLASAAAATIHQYSYRSSHGQYMHLISPSWLPASAPLPPSDTSPPPPSGVFLPLLPGISILALQPLNVLLLPSESQHHVLHTFSYIFPGPLHHPPNPCHQYQLLVLHPAPLSSQQSSQPGCP
ncbi:hypothetical protein ID866_11816 [Astraeus odoratus]|nr:hypothetical protein ID866_11816 [Astraeus odoratus]